VAKGRRKEGLLTMPARSWFASSEQGTKKGGGKGRQRGGGGGGGKNLPGLHRVAGGFFCERAPRRS